MKPSWIPRAVAGLVASLLIGLAPVSVQAIFPVYFNVDFEGETVGQPPSTGSEPFVTPLATAWQFTEIHTNSPGFVTITNNLWGNSSKFAFFDTTQGGNQAYLTANIKPADQPTNGILRIAFELAAVGLVDTASWMQFSFADAADAIQFDFTSGGRFHVRTYGGFDSDVGYYQAGQFTNLEFRIDLKAMQFALMSVNGTQTNFMGGGPVGMPQGNAFRGINPGPGDPGVNYQFGLDNVVIEMIPEPGSAFLLITGTAGIMALRRRQWRR